MTSFKYYFDWLEDNYPAGKVVTLNGQSETVNRVDIIEDGFSMDGRAKSSIAFYLQSGKVIKEADLDDLGLEIRKKYSEYLRQALSFETFLKSKGQVIPRKRVVSIMYSTADSKVSIGSKVEVIRLVFDDGSDYEVFADQPKLILKSDNRFSNGFVDFVGAYFASFLDQRAVPEWYNFEDVLLKDNQFLRAVIEHKSKDGPEVYDLSNPNLHMHLLCWSHPVITYSYYVTLVREKGVLYFSVRESEDD